MGQEAHVLTGQVKSLLPVGVVRTAGHTAARELVSLVTVVPHAMASVQERAGVSPPWLKSPMWRRRHYLL